MKRMKDKKTGKKSRCPETGGGKGGGEDQNYDGMTALRETWKEWEKNDRKRNDRKVRGIKKTMETEINLPLTTRMLRQEQ